MGYMRLLPVLAIVLAVGAACSARAQSGSNVLGIRHFSVASASNEPTLRKGETFLVSLTAYRSTAPERGDMVVFRLPTYPKVEYVKRIVGLPGDRLQLVDNVLHIDGKAVGRERVEDFQTDRSLVPQFEETLPNGRSHRTIDVHVRGEADNTRLYVVPEGHYFVMGDNRDNSTDSRFLDHVGYVPRENIIGKASRILFSWKLGRIGKSLE